MLSGRQKLLGGLLVGVTAMLVGYAVTKTFSGSGEVNAVNFSSEELSADGGLDLSLNSPDSNPPAVTPGDSSTPIAAQAGSSGVPAMPAPVVERPQNRVYTVQSNDSFWKIAQKVYGDAKYVNKLAAANASHKTLRSGMRVICPPFDGAEFQLQLPCVEDGGSGPATDAMASIAPEPTLLGAPTTAGMVADSGETTAEAATGRTHVVASGENLYDIAKKYYNNGSAWPKIAAANPKINANAIKPGQTLVIP